MILKLIIIIKAFYKIEKKDFNPFKNFIIKINIFN
jgi:hypothetical protein